MGLMGFDGNQNGALKNLKHLKGFVTVKIESWL